MGVLLTPVGAFCLWPIAVGYRPILDNEHTAATILTLLAELGVVETPGFEPVLMLTVFLVAVGLHAWEDSPFLRDMTGMEGRTWRCTIVLGERPEILEDAAEAFMSGSGPDICPGSDIDFNFKLPCSLGNPHTW
ncbi:hypothetical protein B0H14DRAFT_3424504 [Mycena olivaceomarginata]|nr:hypothetical protein B0H14DRAFT_3424504 [Mycena olivaceomarginata]